MGSNPTPSASQIFSFCIFLFLLNRSRYSRGTFSVWFNSCDCGRLWAIWQQIGRTGKMPARLQLSTYGSNWGSRLVCTCAFNFMIQVNAEGVCAGAAV